MMTEKNVEQGKFLARYTSHLNDNQLQAVKTVDGPVLLLAVPGSGKTTVLVTRLGYMILCHEIDPRNILTLTYTTDATKDMKQRYIKMFGEAAADNLEFRTINGICYKIILNYASLTGKPESSIFRLISEEKESGRILSTILVDLMDEYPTESDIRNAKTLITYCKNMILNDDEIKKIETDLPLFETYKAYNQHLKDNSLMDYDDQMVYAYKMLKSVPELLNSYRRKFPYICVDEAQDTSRIQHEIIRMLAGDNGNLFMVGDEDQSIYGFRAAYPEALLHFEKDHTNAKVLVMDQNYRSNARIVELADRFIQHNKARHDKHMRSTKDAGAEINFIELNSRPDQYNYLFKVAKDCKSETAVLYRDNESAIPLVDILDRNGIPFRLKKNENMGFFTHRVVTDVTNIMRFSLDPYNTDLFMRIYFKCKTYLKKPQAARMCQISEEKRIPVLNAIDYMDDLSPMVKGKCRAFDSHLKGMAKEKPTRAMIRIETELGYEEYVDNNGLDRNKLYILRTLSEGELSINSFLSRLDYLQSLFRSAKQDEQCNFILSTIHSSKGLEYDCVYLMDICDGVFPSRPLNKLVSSSASDIKEFEEERRLFYVGMTRAKNVLCVFSIKSKQSCFIDELKPAEKNGKKVSVKPKTTAKVRVNVPVATILKSDYELIIGERIIQDRQGAGTVTDVVYDTDNSIKSFTVAYDNGIEKDYSFPVAFTKGMKLENGEIVPVIQETKPLPTVEIPAKSIKRTTYSGKSGGSRNDSYASWEATYPDHVIIKKEGYFWTAHGESAEELSQVKGYKLGETGGRFITGSPSLDAITSGLETYHISYIAVEDGEIVARADFD